VTDVDVGHELDDPIVVALLPVTGTDRYVVLESIAFHMSARGDPEELVLVWVDRANRARCFPPLDAALARHAAQRGIAMAAP
jgi:hypothetical protein